MSDKVDFFALADGSFVKCALLNGIGDKYDKVAATPGFDPANLEVSLVINGVELPFTETLESMGAELDRMIEAKARELMLERTGNLFDELYDMERRIKSIFPEPD